MKRYKSIDLDYGVNTALMEAYTAMMAEEEEDDDDFLAETPVLGDDSEDFADSEEDLDLDDDFADDGFEDDSDEFFDTEDDFAEDEFGESDDDEGFYREQQGGASEIIEFDEE